jgi:DNA processing protein
LEESRLHAIALTMVPGIGPKLAKTLISYCGSPKAVFNEKNSKLTKIPGIGATLVQALKKSEHLKTAEKELQFVNDKNIQILPYYDASYPRRLKQVEDSPSLLYYKGSECLNPDRVVAIVGTRTPSDNGIINCERLVEELKPFNVQVISGLAYGIDSTAHKCCVQCSIPTIGIPGHGLDRIYPAKNKMLLQKMLDNGGILSQFPSGTKPDREHFPMRNKVIAAMADVVVVVESKRSGGSMITATFANDYFKDVFAFPGRIQDENAEGCNKLIKEHRAHLLESAKDISYIMRWEELDAKNRFSLHYLLIWMKMRSTY